MRRFLNVKLDSIEGYVETPNSAASPTLIFSREACVSLPLCFQWLSNLRSANLDDCGVIANHFHCSIPGDLRFDVPAYLAEHCQTLRHYDANASALERGSP